MATGASGGAWLDRSTKLACSYISRCSLHLTFAEVTRRDLTECRLRRTSAWLLLFFLLQGELGAIWDREWHAFVGRDQFWTPPHILIYSCVAGAGFVALAVVLLDTVRYRRGTPGVNDISTVRIL